MLRPSSSATAPSMSRRSHRQRRSPYSSNTRKMVTVEPSTTDTHLKETGDLRQDLKRHAAPAASSAQHQIPEIACNMSLPAQNTRRRHHLSIALNAPLNIVAISMFKYVDQPGHSPARPQTDSSAALQIATEINCIAGRCRHGYQAGSRYIWRAPPRPSAQRNGRNGAKERPRIDVFINCAVVPVPRRHQAESLSANAGRCISNRPTSIRK